MSPSDQNTDPTEREKQFREEIPVPGATVEPGARGLVHENEERLRLAVESAGLGVFDIVWDAGKGVLPAADESRPSAPGDGAGDAWDWHPLARVYYSPQWKAMLGYAESEISNRAEEWRQRVYPDDWETVNAALQPVLDGKTDNYQCEYRLQCKDGSYKWVLARGKVVERRAGKLLRLIGTLYDIDQRKAFEAEIRRLNRLYAVLSEVNQAIVRVRSRQELFEEVARIVVEFGGFAMAWIGWHDPATHAVVPLVEKGDDAGYLERIRVFADDRPEGRGPVGNAIREGRAHVSNDFLNDSVTFPWFEAATHSNWRACAAFPIRLAGEVWGAVAVYSRETGFFGQPEVALLEEAAQDISFALDHLEQDAARRRAEELLKESDERLNLALEAAGLGTWDWDLLSGKIGWDGKHYELFGFQPGEFDGSYSTFEKRLHPDDVAELNRATARARDTRTIFKHEYRVLLPDGTVRWLAGQGEFNYDSDGHPVRMRGAVMDITEQRLAEQRLRASEARYRRIVTTSSEGIWTVDEQLITDFVNDRMAEMLGYSPEEMIGHSIGEFLPEGEGTDRASLIRRGEPVPRERRFRHKSGREVITLRSTTPILDDAGKFRGAIAIFTDITERVHAQEEQARLAGQLQQAQKLESIGRLAGGVAHDFNNLLTVINGHAEMTLRGMHPADPLRLAIEEIHHAGERATALVRHLLAFSRKQILQRQAVKLNVVVTAMEKMLVRLLGEDIEVILERDPSLHAIMADPHQIEQVIMNLTINSRDAMPRGGTLTISTANVMMSAQCPVCSAAIRPGAYVRLSVRDTGTGIDADVRPHLFEPFFTTKPPGKGTGLGLATVHGIVMQSEGHVDVESEPDKGTAFHIYLPAVEEKIEEFPNGGTDEVPGGAETILLVEDQAEVRRVTAAVLKSYGYRVLEASGGDEALGECAGQQVDLLLTDIVMPRMSGPELAGRARALRPGLKTLFFSGYAETRHWQEDEVAAAAFLQKPFSLEELAAKVREVLRKPQSPARIVIVDDDPAVRRIVRLVLEGAGYAVTEAADGREALRRTAADAPDLVITDLIMPKQEGIETIQILRSDYPDVRIIAISGASSPAYLKAAGPLGAHATLAKPIDPDVLLSEVTRVLARR